MKNYLPNLNFLSLLLVFLLFGSGRLNAQITGQPKDVTVCAGTTSISFTVITDKSYFYTCQWWVYSAKTGWNKLTDNSDYKLGISVTGSTSKTVVFGFGKPFPALTTSFSGTAVQCVVSYGLKIGVTSNPAVATVVAAPVISAQPDPLLERVVDQPASFSIVATGTGLSYQWQVNQGSGFLDIPFATSPSYNLKYVTLNDTGTYRCMVSNGICTPRYSNNSVLNVYDILTIDKHPGISSDCETKTTSFSVIATNAIGYQWEVSSTKGGLWDSISGANLSAYSTDPLTTSMNGWQYRCVVSGGAGQTLTSFAGILNVYSNISLTGHPASANKIVGESVTFNVSASGSYKTYQWQFNNANIAGATASSFSIGSVQLSDTGDYRCVLSGICNTDTSNAAILAVTAPTYVNGWVKQTSGSGQNITSISPVSDLNAWALTEPDADQLLKTTDGGTNWTSVATGTAGYWKSLCFVSETTGMVGGSDGISRTTNKGGNWSYTDLKTQFGLGVSDNFTIMNIQFPDTSNGWAVGTNGIVIKTIDGGVSWIRIGYKTGVPKVTDVDLYSVYFIDADTGYIGGFNGILFKTNNGGTNWTELVSPVTSNINDIIFLSATKGFLVTPAINGTMYSTSDGGSTWSKLIIPGTNNLITSVDFVDANNGWAAGSYYDNSTLSYPSLILKTFNGGQTWVSQRIDNTSELYEVRMFNADHGWAVGKAGKIYRTGKGGCYDPIVSLYADQTLCANQYHTLVADTFVNNYNSRYSWSTGSTTGQILVDSTATYSVTITNECGKTASDSATITFLPLPVAFAGENITICEGGSAQLFASGGTGYSWNNEAFLDTNLIANPIATPPSGLPTIFTVTVTDANNCTSTDDVMVTVNSFPTSDFTAPIYVCGTDDGSFEYIGSVEGKSFTWDFSGGVIASGTGPGPILVNWNELGDKLVSLTTTMNNCASTPTLKIVNVREQPASSFEAPVATCGPNPAVLFYTGGAPTDALYSWGIDGGTSASDTGQGPVQVWWDIQGTKTLSLSVTQNECVSGITNHNIIVGYPYEGEQICLVTIDLETGKNMVVWEKTHNVGINSYNVYREGNIQNTYDLIGNVPFDQITIFVDSTSKPEQQQYKYKISAIDSCGNESSKSKWHKTMFLQYVSSVNGVNLNWQEYGVETGSMAFDSYAVFRGSDSTSLAELTTISASFLAYTDNTPDALSKKFYYRVGGVKANACDPAELVGKKASSGPFVHSLSNLEDNRLQSTGITNKLAEGFLLSVYPNPFTDITSINYTFEKETRLKVEVYNLVGEKIKVLLDENQSAGSHKLEMKASDVNYQPGVYYIKIHVDGAVVIRKTMLSR